ncbi:hypothetical protein WJX72_006373 [[Myrmecia] bisecta]|uniref:Major facilitator superfamily (MFS) profile domain-containing protein n=1 Tax=[Myrmecia] bisecta TaxID=41462 RepID=A0AAW1Q728_9CHLO
MAAPEGQAHTSVTVQAVAERSEDEAAALLDPSSSGSGPGGAPEKPPVDWVMTGLAFLFPALGGLLFGYDIGATSGALVSITSATTSGTDWYNLTSFQSGAVVSSSLLGALLGSAAAFVVGDKLGRKRELLLAAVLYGAAAILMYSAPSLAILLAGRATYGVGIGFAMHAAPAYIAETSPASARGLLISLKELLIVAGILSGYLTSYLFVDDVGGWRNMYGLSLLPAIALSIGMAWLPDSPRWLLLSGAGRDRAAAALTRARGKYGDDKAAVDAEISGMIRSAEESASQSGSMSLFQKRNLRPLSIGMSLMLFQQITGQPSVLYYAAKIFTDAGFSGGKDATGVSVILGIVKFLMTGVAVLTVDSWGRRPLLLTGVTGMTLALMALGGSQFASLGGLATWVSLIALLVYVGCYQVSFGPISWLMVGEVFPLAVRGQASALATLTNFGSNFGVSLVLPSVQENFGIANTYLAFAVISLVALGTIYAIVPETKGKTLEEIEALWSEEDKGE